MSPRLNLVPVAYRQACRRRLRVRRLIAAGAVLVVVQVVLGAALNRLAVDVRETQKRLVRLRQDQTELQQRLARLTAEESLLDRQIVLMRHLTRKHRWSEILDLVVGALPDTVRLTRIETIPPVGRLPDRPADERTTAARPAAAPAAAAAAAAPQAATGLLIGGLAADHESVALFLRQLRQRNVLGTCTLESTQRQPFLSGQAVGFTIRTQW